MKIAECGFVYMITSPSGRIYVGSTIDIENRWCRYTSCNCKKQIKLYNSLIKYGPKNHIFEIIWAGPIYDMLKYEAMIGIGFNCLENDIGLNLELPKIDDRYSYTSSETCIKRSLSQKGKKASERRRKNMKGLFHVGFQHSESTIKKMKESRRNLIPSKKCIEMASLKREIPVIQLDLDGCFIKEWESARKAFICLGIANTTIVKCCKGKAKSAGGYTWKYK